MTSGPKSFSALTRLGRVKRMPCICCATMGIAQPSITEVHHLVDMGNRKASGGDFATIPLCGWHHRAEPRLELTRAKMLPIYGPSLKFQGSKGGFANAWGTERSLLAKINERLSRIYGEIIADALDEPLTQYANEAIEEAHER